MRELRSLFRSGTATNRQIQIMSSRKHICLTIALVLCTEAFGQQTGPQRPAQLNVRLVSLAEPVYPPLARQAGISGEVRIAVTIHRDGSTETTLESGHPMLIQAALDSAKMSHFECVECSSSGLYVLVYAFTQVRGSDCCTAFSKPASVKQEALSLDEAGRPQTRVILSAEQICLCDHFSQATKARSIKCLYLWRCSL
jgi:hypothetical protein